MSDLLNEIFRDHIKRSSELYEMYGDCEAISHYADELAHLGAIVMTATELNHKAAALVYMRAIFGLGFAAGREDAKLDVFREALDDEVTE